MGRRIAIATVVGVLLLIGAAVGAYAWDSSKANEIADGVRVGSVDLGGLSERQAAKLLRKELVEPLSEPVRAKVAGEEFTLHPEELDVRADIDGMVAEASAASREGWIGERVIRYATGGEVEREIAPQVTYSEDAVAGFVDGVAAKVNREPRDASIEPSPASLNPVRERDGIAVEEGELRNGIDTALRSGAPGQRVVRASVERVKPEVTTDELAREYPYYITINRGAFELRFYRDLKLVKTYTIAVGQVGYDTPAGLYHIQNKAVNPAWSVPNSDWTGDLAGQVIPGGAANNPLKARWMGIYDGAGIHGTDDVGSLGTAASHGCIRMAIPDVIALYEEVPVRTPTYIF